MQINPFMMYTEKQVLRANRAFESAVKEASKCREKKRLVSCFTCKQYNTCPIQDRVDKNLAVKRGEVYVHRNNLKS